MGLHPVRPRTGLTYAAARLIAYVVAFILLVLIYSTKQRGLLIAPAVALVGAAVTFYFLGDAPADDRRRATLAAGVGLVLGELAWAMGYWSVPALTGGAALFLAVHVLAGLVEHSASQSLDRRIAWEYGLVALIGALIVLVFGRPLGG